MFCFGYMCAWWMLRTQQRHSHRFQIWEDAEIVIFGKLHNLFFFKDFLTLSGTTSWWVLQFSFVINYKLITNCMFYVIWLEC